MDSLFASQATLAILVSFVMQWLKKQPWFPLLNVETGKLNLAVSAFVAFLSGVGIAVKFDKTAGILTIGGLTLMNVLHALYLGAQQFLMQHFTYKVAIAPPVAGIEQSLGSTRLGPSISKPPDLAS